MLQKAAAQPSYWTAFGIALGSLLAGASFVHYVYKPSLGEPQHHRT